MQSAYIKKHISLFFLLIFLLITTRSKTNAESSSLSCETTSPKIDVKSKVDEAFRNIDELEEIENINNDTTKASAAFTLERTNHLLCTIKNFLGKVNDENTWRSLINAIECSTVTNPNLPKDFGDATDLVAKALLELLTRTGCLDDDCINDPNFPQNVLGRLCYLKEELYTIETKIDAMSLNDDLLYTIQSKVFSQNTEIDEIISREIDIESKIDAMSLNDDLLYTIQSKVFAQNDEISTMDSKLDVIDDKIDTVDSKVDVLDDKIDTLDSKMDVMDDKVDTIESKVFAQNTEIDEIISREIDIESKIDVIDKSIDDLLEIETVESHCPTILYTSDFGTSGTTISVPGYYILCDDVPFAPSGVCSAITTATDHVTIDLNYHAIYQSNTQANVNAIKINPSIHDVTVKNGSLSDFTQYGIYVDSTSGAGCYNLTFENIKIEHSGSSGIYFDGASGSEIHDCIFRNCSVTNVVTRYVVWLERCNDIKIFESTFNNNTATSDDDYVLRIIYCNKLQLSNCHINDNLSTITNAYYGQIYADHCSALLFEHCLINNNSATGSGGDVNPIWLENCSGYKIHDCSIITNSANDNVYCIYDYLGNGNTISSCFLQTNTSTSGLVEGITLYSCTGNDIIDCTCNNQDGNNASAVYGIDFVNSDSCSIQNCKANYSTNGTGDAIGIYINTNSENCYIKNCATFSNDTVGIKNDHATTQIVGCTSSNNTTNFGGTYPATYARRNERGSHWKIGEQENISIETTGINDVGCVVYLDKSAFGTSGITLSDPGYYILCEDVDFAPSGACSAITTATDHVTIDLNYHAIYQSNTQATVNAIKINPSIHDVTVKNGSLSDFTQYGIYVDSSSGTGCYYLHFENLNISKCRDVLFDGSSGAEIRNCKIINCQITEGKANPPVGGSFGYCKDFEIRCLFFGNTSYPLYFFECHKINLIDCQFNNINASGTGLFPFYNTGGFAIGIMSSLESNLSFLIESCKFYNNSSTLSDTSGCFSPLLVYGASFSIEGVIIRNCIIENNSATGGNLFGIGINGGIANIIENCLINNNSSNYSCYGISLNTEADTDIIGCTIKSNVGASTGISAGIYFDDADNCSIRQCKTDNNDNSNDATKGYGIYIDSDSTKCLIKDCLAFANSGYGISNNNANTSNPTLVTGCVAGNNGTANYSGASAAITPHYARRNELGNHFEIGEEENISIETTGINDVGCVVYLDSSAFATTLTISDPGYYILCEDVPFAPGVACSAITTATDHVTIDLNYHAIYQPGTTATVDAITINPNVHDVTIKNGSLSDFTRYGIYVDSTSGAGCYNLTFENIKIEHSGSSGIYFDGTSGSEIHDCIFRNCSVTNVTSEYVVWFEYCNDIKIFDSTFNNNTAATDNAWVLGINYCDKLQLSNCQINDNLSTRENAHYIQIEAYRCSALLFENCSINNNRALGNSGTLYLMLMEVCYGYKINGCSIITNNADDDIFCIYDNSGIGNTISSCFIQTNTVSNGIVNGISFGATQKSDIIDCTCNSLSGNENGNDVYGIEFNGANNCSIQNCKVNYMTNSGTGDAIGIHIDLGSNNSYIKNCSTFSNKTNGIKNDDTTSIIVGCAAANNGTDYYGACAISFCKTGSTVATPVYKYDNVQFTLTCTC